MRNLFAFAVLAAALFTAMPAWAQRMDQLPGGSSAPAVAPAPTLSGGIAAIVNESVISIGDVRNRLKLGLLSAGLPDTPEARTRIAPQVLRSLVDEQLQLQEAKKLDVSVSAEEIAAALKQIAQDNKIPGGDIVAFLTKEGVPPSTLRSQIKATISWNKVVMRTLRPRVDIGDDEIEAVVQRMRANTGKQEYLVSEIFLPVDKPEDEAEAKALASNLLEQVKGGAVFGAVARQFSQNAGASAGGDIGWIQAGQLAPEVDKVLQGMQPGSIAGPIRSASGYHIIGVRDRRTIALGDPKEVKVKLQQAFHSYDEQNNKEALVREGARMAKDISSCDGLRERLALSFSGWRWQDLGEIKMGAAPAWLTDKISAIDEGRAGDPMATDKGVLVLFVCGRAMPEGSVDRGAIRTAIGTERLDLLARRQMRDLRREAFIDVRMKSAP